MKNILAFNGSVRKNGNTFHLLNHFLDGCTENTSHIEVINAHELNLKYCTGCLRCNILKRCSLRDDDWQNLSEKILKADVLVFASPVYFHHVSSQLKKIIDRFRSFVHVQITETGLIHTPHVKWQKDFVLLLSMGNPGTEDAGPAINLFNYMTGILGQENRLHTIEGTRLAVSNHVVKTEEELTLLYSKMNLPPTLAGPDYLKNRKILEECTELGRKLSKL